MVTLKVHVFTTFIIFIYFCDVSKRKKKKKMIFFFEKFKYTWGTHTEVPRVQVPKKYPVQIRLHFWSTRAS